MMFSLLILVNKVPRITIIINNNEITIQEATLGFRHFMRHRQNIDLIMNSVAISVM